MKYGWMAVCAALLLQVVAADAGIYKWRDEAGVMHFTDNKDDVPPRYRKGAPVEGLSDAAVTTVSDSGAGSAGVFARKCGSCHVVAYEADGERVPLLSVALDRETGMTRSVDAVFAVLRKAADGRFSDMPAMSVSDDELRLIARFLTRKVGDKR